jgi:hypothetical protein
LNSTARLAGPGIVVRQNGGLKGRDPLWAPLQGMNLSSDTIPNTPFPERDFDSPSGVLFLHDI